MPALLCKVSHWAVKEQDACMVKDAAMHALTDIAWVHWNCKGLLSCNGMSMQSIHGSRKEKQGAHLKPNPRNAWRPDSRCTTLSTK